ncbi:MAG TPA: hypothetical protein VEH06_11795, partial [Candidatus Bathyarchaeia archaeon]|nr:hypothetical protein [Candidatus Bathyarchaeia archaeon]
PPKKRMATVIHSLTVNNYSERYHAKATGSETWLDLPGLKTQISLTPPPRWKMAIVVFIAR